jgi:hypothetical protein
MWNLIGPGIVLPIAGSHGLITLGSIHQSWGGRAVHDGWVIAGAIRFQVADGPMVTRQAGDAFFEPANVPIPHSDNSSDTEPAAFIACYLRASGEDQLIEMLG